MRIILTAISFALVLMTQFCAAQKQDKTPSQKNETMEQNIFEDKMMMPRPLSMAQGIVEMGKSFIGTPYPKVEADTSAGHGVVQPIEPEVLVVNFQKFDCVTFVESIIALAQARSQTVPSFENFNFFLTHIRYRNGIIDYPHRLHYFSDWLYENEKNGTIKDITKELGGVVFKKKVFFMTLKGAPLYKDMADSTNFKEMKKIEQTITKREKCYIPKDRVAAMESKLKNGDIIGITNAIDGLDIAHTGIIVRKNGRAYMLHASSQHHQVMLTDIPLVDYLQRYRIHTGIMVGRLQE